jgi:predicted Zn-dependent protease
MFMPASRRLLTAAALLVLAAVAGPRQLAAQHPSPAELREMGRRLWKEQVRRDGRVTDPARNEAVKTMMDRLQHATGQAGLTLTWAIVNNDTVNAWAAPGGYIAIFRGLMDFADSVAHSEFPRDPAAARARSNAFVAGVVAHEISHVTLNHSGDPTVSQCMSRMEREGGLAAGNSSGRTGSETRLVRSSVDCMGYSQNQELAADRLGAIYLLRENWRGATEWTIQGMIDFFAKMDEMQRQRNYFFSPYMSSYLSSHPRGPTRVAQLEMYRAQLKLNQTRLDDALSLIAGNIELDLALSLLDSVEAHFPDLVAARLARAAVYQRRYLNTVPVQSLQVRASVPTSQALFMENIRGEDMGDLALQAQARRMFEEVLLVDQSPATLSNLAILDAYAKNYTQAEARARAALAEDSLNPELLNNLGVVLYLAGKLPQSRDAFKASLEVSGDSGMGWVVLPPFFNYGRTLLAMNNPEGREILERYIRFDEASEWGKEARRLTGGQATSNPTPARQRTSDKAGQGDLVFGATLDQISAAWGEPESVEQLEGGILLRYPNGRSLVVSHDKGLTAFVFSRPEAGDVGGVKVGDPIDRLLQQVQPSEIQGNTYFFQGQGLMVIAQVNGRTIVQLAVARVE